MKSLAWLLFHAAILMPCGAAAAAEAEEADPQPRPADARARDFPQAELERLVAPVALYPDTLLSLVLMAATYPAEITEAARWSKQNPGLQGEAAVRAVTRQPWDTSVRVLAGFPLLLSQMSESMDWTRRLGQSYLAREAQVLDAVQGLRQRALSAGHLRGGELAVERRGANIVIESASASSVHVPHYSPATLFGAGSPEHPPIEWAAWPGHAKRSGAIAWGPAVPMSRSFVYGGFDWRARHAHIANIRSYATAAIATSAPRSVEVVVREAKPEEAAIAEKAPIAAPSAPPVPLVDLLPPPAPRVENKPAQPQPGREQASSALKKPSLLDLFRQHPASPRNEAPRQAPVAVARAAPDAASTGASIIRLMPGALDVPEASARTAPVPPPVEPKPAPVVVEPKPAPLVVEPKPATVEPPAVKADERAREVPPAPAAKPAEPSAPKREEVAAPAPREEPAPVPVATVAVPPQSATAGAGAPARPRPKAFVSDADRKTLDFLLPAGPGGTRAAR
jgi:hypothetical protein